VARGDPDICYATDWGATIRTTDGWAHWEQVYTNMQPDGSAASRGPDVTTCYGVHFDPFDPQHIFVSYTDIDASHSFDGGESRLRATSGVHRQWINTCCRAVFDPEVESRTWSRIKGYNFKWGHRPVVDPLNPGMLYLTTFGGGLHYGPAAGDPAAVEDIVNWNQSRRWGN